MSLCNLYDVVNFEEVKVFIVVYGFKGYVNGCYF